MSRAASSANPGGSGGHTSEWPESLAYPNEPGVGLLRSGTVARDGGLLHPSVEGVIGVEPLFDLRDGLLVGEKYEPLGLLGLDGVSEGVSESPLNNMLVVTNGDGAESECICGLDTGEKSSGRGRRGANDMVTLLFEW